MRVFNTIEDWRRFRAASSGSSGLVPTLGALHDGHAALIRQARADNQMVVVSIFLNPTQFNRPQDLASYPVTHDEDLARAAALGVDAVFAPPREAMYADGYRFKVEESEFSRELCGAHRPGHFAGVLTVVMKLLNLIRPDRAYFGEKDYQQLMLVRDMADAFFMDVAIVPGRTVRDADGLALSSRNALLDAEGRCLAPKLHQLLASDRSDGQVAEALARAGFDVDYVVTRAGRRFGAASLTCGGKTVRLIDNVALEACAES